jgi:hypothetical protein
MLATLCVAGLARAALGAEIMAAVVIVSARVTYFLCVYIFPAISKPLAGPLFHT